MTRTSSIASIDSPAMRQEGHDLLSLALMDARNHTLHLLGQYEAALGEDEFEVPILPELNPPLWELGHIGWYQEWWLARNVQRELGVRCNPNLSRLPSIEPRADQLWDPSCTAHALRWDLAMPDFDSVKAYLLETLEISLELLEKAPDDDDALYFFRLALFHEDMHGEGLIHMAQTLDLPLTLAVPGPVPQRAPLLVPATHWQQGSDAGQGGFTFDNERPAHEIRVPEFEIDAQVVNWSQFVEFVDDGGYDRPELWHPQGWHWVLEQARRAPRYVEQIGVASGAVLQNRFGMPRRMLAGQSVMHVSWWEADAWCRWAGRRLPIEVEWEVAAHTAVRRGFRWGDVWEWTGTTFRGYPGFVADPDREYSRAFFDTHKVLRGASFASRARMKSPKFRYFSEPQCDHMFVGFRSCAL